MENLGSIAAVYVVTFVTIFALVIKTLRKGQRLVGRVLDKDKPWT